MSVADSTTFGGKLGLGIEMVIEGRDPPASLLLRKEDSTWPRFKGEKIGGN